MRIVPASLPTEARSRSLGVADLAATMPAIASRNAAVNSRENEWGSADSALAGAVGGSVSGGW
jgi:hypothetical protein